MTPSRREFWIPFHMSGPVDKPFKLYAQILCKADCAFHQNHTHFIEYSALEAAEARITQLESDNGIFDLTIKRLINTNAAGEADLRGELIKSEARIAKLREALQAVIEKVVHYASAGCIEAYSQYDDTGLCEEVERARQALSDDRTQGEK